MKTLEAGLKNPKLEVDLEVGHNNIRNGNKQGKKNMRIRKDPHVFLYCLSNIFGYLISRLSKTILSDYYSLKHLFLQQELVVRIVLFIEVRINLLCHRLHLFRPSR